MRCVLVALADAANVSLEGKLNILGEFDRIFCTATPTVWPLMTFVAKLKTSEADVGSRHSMQLQVLDEDMQLAAVAVDGVIHIQSNANPGIESGLPIIIPIRHATFQRPGTYLFRLVVNAMLMCEAQLHVVVQPPDASEE